MLSATAEMIKASKFLFRSNKINRHRIGLKTQQHNIILQPKEIEQFAKATGDFHYDCASYRSIPPFYITKLGYDSVSKILKDPTLNLNLLKLVHSSMEVHWYQPILIRHRLNITSELLSIEETSAGNFIKIKSTAFIDVDPACVAYLGFIVRTSTKKTEQKKHVSQPRLQAPMIREKIVNFDRQNVLYAHASDDHNPIHLSYLVARMTGFKRPILHGACLLASSHNTMNALVKEQFNAEICSISARFSAPVLPGTDLWVLLYNSSVDNELEFSVVDQSDRPLIKNGKIQLKKSSSRNSI